MNACYHSVQNLLSSRQLSKNIKDRIYKKAIILPVILHWCGTWSLTLREEHKLSVFENMVLRRIYGPKRDEMAGDWRKFHNEELHKLCFSSSIIRTIKSERMRWIGHLERMGKKKNTHRILVGKPEGKRPLGRPKCRWGHNIKMDLKEMEWGDMN
jgi:hypothetical protein